MTTIIVCVITHTVAGAHAHVVAVRILAEMPLVMYVQNIKELQPQDLTQLVSITQVLWQKLALALFVAQRCQRAM